MEFSQEQIVAVEQLVKAGFPLPLAQTAVAAKAAGLEDADKHIATMLKGGKPEDTDTSKVRAKLEAELKKLTDAGDRSIQAVQRRIALKGQIARLK